MQGIYFPGFNIFFEKVLSAITILNVKIPLYAVCVTGGFILALIIASKEAQRTGQNDEDYLDFFLWLVIPAIAGARIYYIIFNHERFIQPGKSLGKTILDMVNIHNGGLAVYGGLIAGVLAGFIFAKKKRLNFPLFGDTIALGVVAAQILGRWGNFFNRECFGSYTASKFRMAIPVNYFSSGYFQTLRNEGVITSEMLSNQELVKGIACFTVHPTFLYEGLWNLALLIFLLLYRKKKKFDGELAMLYVAGYGLGRFWIEWMRTDSLMIGSLKVSQVVAAICFFLAVAVIVKNRIDIKNGKTPKVNYVPNKKTEDDSEDSESEESESKEESEEKESEDKKKKDKKNIKDKLKASKESDEEEESDEEDEDDVEEEPTDDAE
ncbi:MAG: prolipoprotein diacylglyceryl transferase [Eubacterium sp.]|nr:prolipoprotein diacylglyceryl transferase [Eubacterium sp.]